MDSSNEDVSGGSSKEGVRSGDTVDGRTPVQGGPAQRGPAAVRILNLTTFRRMWEQLARRTRQGSTLLRAEGPRAVAAKLMSGIALRLDTQAMLPSVRAVDVLDADLSNPWSPPMRTRRDGDPMLINWVMPPPGEHSGGHTTAFRLIRHLEAQGHTSRIYFYDVYGGDLRYYRDLLRRSYAEVEVASVFDGMPDADAVFATCWESAYAVFNARCAGKRFYLVQDFEPWFYPASATAALAENSYRMGFHAITAGRWLSSLLSSEYGMAADHFDFGCDTDVYTLQDVSRNGIVFYARPDTPRRAFELGLLALELFSRQHPDVEIHMYGDSVADLGPLQFTYVDHGLVSPGELNSIYNRCFAGLSLSMTNVSLVPHEMLAAGCIPIVNEAEHNRVVLANAHVRYVDASPHALAKALSDVVTDPNYDAIARAASASVQATSWDGAGHAIERVLLREVGGS